MSEPQKEMDFDEKMDDIRVKIKQIAEYVKEIKEQKANAEIDGKEDIETDGKEDIGEVMANLMLSYRHLEDASMRIGKVMQARNGGVSIYDKNAVGNK